VEKAHARQPADHTREGVVGDGDEQQIAGREGDLVGSDEIHTRKQTPGGARGAGHRGHVMARAAKRRREYGANLASADDTNNHDPVLVCGVPVGSNYASHAGIRGNELCES